MNVLESRPPKSQSLETDERAIRSWVMSALRSPIQVAVLSSCLAAGGPVFRWHQKQSGCPSFVVGTKSTRYRKMGHPPAVTLLMGNSGIIRPLSGSPIGAESSKSEI